MISYSVEIHKNGLIIMTSHGDNYDSALAYANAEMNNGAKRAVITKCEYRYDSDFARLKCKKRLVVFDTCAA